MSSFGTHLRNNLDLPDYFEPIIYKRSKAKQSKAKQSKAKQSKAKQSKAKQSKAKQSKAKQIIFLSKVYTITIPN